MRNYFLLKVVFFFLSLNTLLNAAICDNVTDVPKSECDALVALYNSTDGANWNDNTNWLTSTTVGAWFGITVSGGHVTKIELKNNNLTGTIATQIGDLSAGLEILMLAQNSLSGTIPVELWNLTKLRGLYLYGNSLTGGLSSQVGNLVNLTALDINGNQLGGAIPDTLWTLTNLNWLYIQNCSFVGEISPNISNLTKLRGIKIRENQLSGDIPIVLANHPDIIQVEFRNNNFVFSDFEKNHNDYSALQYYNYKPQAKVDTAKSVTFSNGSTLKIVPSVLANPSGNDRYQWYKDGVAINGATQRIYIKENASSADEGVYTYEITNTVVSDLTLVSNDFTVTMNDGAFVTTWKTDNAGVSNFTSISIPMTGSGYDVDWNNDGIIDETGLSGPLTHDFGTAGIYTVRVYNATPRLRFGNSGDKDKIISIDQWGNGKWFYDMARAFYGCSNLAGQATDIPDFSNVTNMSKMFCRATAFNQNINGWNVSKVTNMAEMFSSALSFNQPIGDWNTSSVTNINNMFRSAKAFNQPIGNWDVSKVTNMMQVFAYADAFNQPIGDWNTSSVTNMYGMFEGARSFNRPIDDWDVSNVTNMANMFNVAIKFNQTLNSWDVSNVTNMWRMFYRASSFNQPIGDWNVSNVTNMKWMFSHTTSFNQPIGNWDVSKVTDMSSMFAYVPPFNQDISDWNVSNVTDMAYMFRNVAAFDQPIGKWDVSKVTDMAEMFAYASSFNHPIGDWNVSNVTNMRSMFAGASVFNQPIGNWDVSNVTNMANMFDVAHKFNQPIGNWDVSQVTNMKWMFYRAFDFDQPIGGWDVSNVTNMERMFCNAKSFNQPIGNWNVGSVTNMKDMFYYAVKFNQDISDWDVSNVTNMTNFLNHATLSSENYDNLLIKWNNEALQSGLSFHGGYSNYCRGENARSNIISGFGWSIVDNGKDCSSVKAIADFQFDECSWTNGVFDIVDSSSFERNASSFYMTPSSIAQINKAADFTKNSTSDLISLDNAILNGVSDFAISLWINTTSTSSALISGANSSVANELILWLENDTTIELWIKNNYTQLTIPSVADGNWHMITWTRSGDMNCIYVDGANKVCQGGMPTGALLIDSGGLILGQEQDSVGGNFDINQDYEGYLDELKIFDVPIDDARVLQIYNYEKNGKGYTGLDRDGVSCTLSNPPKAEYRLDECTLNGTPKEIKDSVNDYDGVSSFAASSYDALKNLSIDLSVNSNSDYISLDSRVLNGQNGFSLSLWLKTGAGDYQSIISGAHSGGTSEDANEVLLWLRDSGYIEFFLKGIRSNKIPIQNIQDNSWHHLVLTRKDQNFVIFIDGNKEINATFIDSSTAGSVTIDNGGLMIGIDQDSVGGNLSENFLGKFDEVKIFDRVLTESEVEIIYANDKSELNYDGTFRNVPSCSMAVEYRFDKCSWNDGVSDIVDTSGHDMNATPYLVSSSQTGKINNSADFNADSVVDMIDLNSTLVNGLEDFTISCWIKTSYGGMQSLLSGANSSDDNELLFWIENSTTMELWLMGRYEQFTVPNIADNVWHMLTWTRKSDKICLYIDGKNIVCYSSFPTGGINLDPSGLILGQEQDSVAGGFDSNQDFQGLMDEFKIFKLSMTPTQVAKMYENESAHKNFDGSHRMAVDCTAPVLLAEYRFDECKYTGAADEVIDSAFADNDGTLTSGDINISKNQKVIGHALELNGGAVDIDNLAVTTQKYKKHTVMFWMYWDAAANSVMPFGWRYYDLWLKSGYFGFNTSKSDLYGISSSSLGNGWHHVAAVFTNEDIYSNRLYIDGVLQSLSQLKNTPDNTKSLVDSSARIGGWRNSDNFRFKSYLDELKIYKGEVNATEIANIYNGESTAIRNIICAQPIFNVVDFDGGCFNWNNNIKTKIAGSNISMSVLAADKSDNNASLVDANITKLELLSFNDTSCSTLYNTTEIWSGNQEVNASGCFTVPVFSHDKAVRCAKIRVLGSYKGDIVESNSTDEFSIRPEKFKLQNLPANKLTAEQNYIFKAAALNSDGTTLTRDFNFSVAPASKKYFRDDSDGSSMDGTFTPTGNFNFTDGLSADTTLGFDNVGKVSLELNDTTWSIVDSDDTPLAQRRIYLEQNLTFIPDRFDISFPATPLMSNHNDGKFTYFANDLANMGANLKNLSFTVKALGKNGSIMTNYQNPQNKYFANDIDFYLKLKVEKNPNLSSNIDENIVKDLNFTAGAASISYGDLKFNFGRNFSILKNPLYLKGLNSDINISLRDRNDTTVKSDKLQTFDGNSTFYYARLRTADMKTTQSPVKGEMDIEVYWDGNGVKLIPSRFVQMTKSWYLNTDDDAVSSIQNSDFNPMKKRKLQSVVSGVSVSVDTPNPKDGKVGFSIAKTDTTSAQKIFYHVDIPSWLWFSKYEDYNFTVGSSCAEHPCFEYIFDYKNDTSGIKSGDFNGSSFDNSFDSGIKKKAIKILR